MKRIICLICLLIGWCAPTEAAEPHIDELLRKGRSLYEFGRWSDARDLFREARGGLRAKDRAELEMVDYYLAICAVELGRPDAEQILSAYAERYPGSVYNNEIQFALGSHYCSTGALTQAREAFERCDYKALPREERERYDLRMGYLAFSSKAYDEADSYFSRIDLRSEYADHATYYRAYINYLSGNREAAKDAFRSLLTSRSYGELAPYYLLQLEFQEGNYRYVVEQGEQLVVRAAGERKVELERVMAESWFHLEEYTKTLESLDRYAAAGGPADRDSDYLRGFSLYRLARYDEAVAPLRAACGADDALTQNASYHLADCYLRQGKKADAMQAFTMATDERYDAAIAEDALFNCGKLQYELGGGTFNNAIHLLSRYVERYPRSQRIDEARTLLVAAYYNSRDYDAAYRALKAMPHRDADLNAALQKITYFRALEAYEADDLAAADRYLAEAAQINVAMRYTALCQFWQGEIAYRRGDYTVAATKYENFLKRTPRTEREYALSRYNLGYCRFNAQRLSQAEQDFKQFMELYAKADAFRTDTRNRLADIARSERRYDEALTLYNQNLTASDAGRHYAAYQRAQTLGLVGRIIEKESALKQLLTKGEGPYLESASYELGRSYLARENYAAAATQLTDFVTKWPSSSLVPQAWSSIGLAYQNLGEETKSMEAYNRVVAAAPGSAEAREALRGIREIYVSRGDVDGYFAYATQAGIEGDHSAVARDSLSFVAARNFYLADRTADAEKSLRSYLKSYPEGAYRTDALYYLSDCYLRSDNTNGAIETLGELVDRGMNQYTDEAVRKYASLCWESERYAEAATANDRLYALSTDAAERQTAMVRYVRATVALGDEAAVEQMAKKVLSRNDAGATALREARFALAEQLRTSGRGADAQEHYEVLAKDLSTREGSAAAYYRIEYLYNDGKGDLSAVEQAIFAYSERSPKAYYLAKAYLLLGDIYLTRGDHYQARATYQSVADGYSPLDDGIVDEAKARIKNLN